MVEEEIMIDVMTGIVALTVIGIEIMTAPAATIQGEENVHDPGSAGAMRGTKC